MEVADLRGEKLTEENVRKFLNNIDAVGITVTNFSFKNSIALCKLIKGIDKDIPVIIGGPLCSLYPRKSLLEMDADISIKGEGENLMNSIEKILDEKTNLIGLYYRKGNEIKGNGIAEEVENLDIIPFPSRHLVEKYEYGYLFGYKFFKQKFTAILTSRGCPYNCRFCSKIDGMKRYRERSPENVVDEIERLDSDGYNAIAFMDNNFLANKKRADKIMDLIVDKEMEMDFMVQGARIDSANPETFKKMCKAGVKVIAFGIESGAQEVLDFYKKKITIEEIRYAVKLSKKFGFFTIGNFILSAPIETKKHLYKTIKFATSLPLDFAMFFPLDYSAGSELWKMEVENGRIGEEEYLVRSDSGRGIGKFTANELEKWQQKAYIGFYFNPKYLTRRLIDLMKRRDFRIFRGGMNLMRIIFE